MESIQLDTFEPETVPDAIKAIGIHRAVERLKVAESFEYFLDEYVWIEDKDNNRAIKLELWPEQRRILPAMVNEKLLIILKARQLGLTWLDAAKKLWRAISNPLYLGLVISVNEDLAQEYLSRIYFMLDRIPSWLHSEVITKTTTKLEFKKGKLISTIKSLPTTEMGAQSKTPNELTLDESCMNRMVKAIFNASYPGIEQASGQVTVISNSIKTGPGWGWTRDTYTKSMRGENDFKRIFLSWTAHPGRRDNFLQLMSASGMDDEDISEHYPATEKEAIAAATGSYFRETLDRHTFTRVGHRGALKKVKDKIDYIEEAKGILEVWRYPYHLLASYDELPWTKRYCIGSDVSEGLGESYSGAYVYDRLNQEMVARLRSNRIDAHTWGKMLYLLSQYYHHGLTWKAKENALICVETTGAGQTTVRYLEETKGTTLYMQQAAPKAGSELTMRFGWHESNQAKHDLSEDLRNWFRHTKGTVFCQVLLDECSTWISVDGRIGPESDSKLGDMVVSAGLCIQADKFMGGAPKQLEAPLTGWRKRRAEAGQSSWTV